MIHLVTLDFPPDVLGGVASWAEDLARALVGAGHDVTVYAKYTGRSAEYDAILPFPVIRMQGRSWAKWQAVWVRTQVAPRVKKDDTVLFATWPLAVLLGPIAAQKGARTGVFFHGSELTELKSTPLKLRFLLKYIHACLPVSNFLNGLLAKHGAEGKVVPMPLQMGPQPGVPGTGLVVVSRLNKRKGIDRVIHIARALDWPVTIVGEGPGRPGLEVAQIESGARVEFIGRLPRVRAVDAYLGKAATLLLPRTNPDGTGAEGLGLVLLESAARGIPTIGCRTGGVPEACDLVLENPDDAAASAETLREWLKGGPRGQEAWDRVNAEHGPARAVQALGDALWS
jgi:phosphatidyl-myo-inositol dimannoside synthase